MKPVGMTSYFKLLKDWCFSVWLLYTWNWESPPLKYISKFSPHLQQNLLKHENYDLEKEFTKESNIYETSMHKTNKNNYTYPNVYKLGKTEKHLDEAIINLSLPPFPSPRIHFPWCSSFSLCMHKESPGSFLLSYNYSNRSKFIGKSWKFIFKL